MNVLYKTKMCNYQMAGNCRHDSEAEIRPSPDFRKTKLCRMFQKGLCNDSNCSRAHGEEERRIVDKFYKTKVCKYWRDQGTCIRGSECYFAHSESEIKLTRARHNTTTGLPPATTANSTARQQEPAQRPLDGGYDGQQQQQHHRFPPAMHFSDTLTYNMDDCLRLITQHCQTDETISASQASSWRSESICSQGSSMGSRCCFPSLEAATATAPPQLFQQYLSPPPPPPSVVAPSLAGDTFSSSSLLSWSPGTSRESIGDITGTHYGCSSNISNYNEYVPSEGSTISTAEPSTPPTRSAECSKDIDEMSRLLASLLFPQQRASECSVLGTSSGIKQNGDATTSSASLSSWHGDDSNSSDIETQIEDLMKSILEC